MTTLLMVLRKQGLQTLWIATLFSILMMVLLCLILALVGFPLGHCLAKSFHTVRALYPYTCLFIVASVSWTLESQFSERWAEGHGHRCLGTNQGQRQLSKALRRRDSYAAPALVGFPLPGSNASSHLAIIGGEQHHRDQTILELIASLRLLKIDFILFSPCGRHSTALEDKCETSINFGTPGGPGWDISNEIFSAQDWVKLLDCLSSTDDLARRANRLVAQTMDSLSKTQHRVDLLQARTLIASEPEQLKALLFDTLRDERSQAFDAKTREHSVKVVDALAKVLGPGDNHSLKQWFDAEAPGGLFLSANPGMEGAAPLASAVFKLLLDKLEHLDTARPKPWLIILRGPDFDFCPQMVGRLNALKRKGCPAVACADTPAELAGWLQAPTAEQALDAFGNLLILKLADADAAVQLSREIDRRIKSDLPGATRSFWYAFFPDLPHRAAPEGVVTASALMSLPDQFGVLRLQAPPNGRPLPMTAVKIPIEAAQSAATLPAVEENGSPESQWAPNFVAPEVPLPPPPPPAPPSPPKPKVPDFMHETFRSRLREIYHQILTTPPPARAEQGLLE